MSFKIKQGRFIARMDFGELGHPQGNVMAFFFRDDPVEANTWKFQYRFRYYRDDKIYQSADTRSQDYLFSLKGTFDELLPKIHWILTLMTVAAGSPFPDEVVVDSDDPQTVEKILFAQPWCHPEAPLSHMNPNPVGIA